MQEFVFFISGNVKKPLTIDPTVWIFDERKIDLNAFFESGSKLEEDNDLTDYTKKISEQFDREMLEGSEPPNPNRDSNKIKFNRQELINGSFGMPLKSFIKNASPFENASTIQVETTDETVHAFPLEKGTISLRHSLKTVNRYGMTVPFTFISLMVNNINPLRM